ncbi:MAG: DUF4912 domain-containing protein, partial [Planctomycetota bacterium]|nr:DUF4912 domain-containing protein [Planctomycetota bacterium]
DIAGPGQPWDGVRRNHVFDIEIRPEEMKRYIEFWSADKAYIVDLGLRARDGRFLTICRSNWMRIPRDSAGGKKEEWLAVEALRTPPLRPEAPECFPPAVRPMPASESDWPLRDWEAESIVKWAYERFLREGCRVFRRIAVQRPDNAVLLAAYEKRQAERSAIAAAAPEPASAPSAPAVDLFLARLDRASNAAPAAVPRTASRFLIARNGLARWSERLSRQTGAKLIWLCDRRWQAAADKMRGWIAQPHSRSGVLPAPAAARPVLRLHKPKNLFQALAEAGVEMEAEIILRGRVKPGKKLRIGNRIIETNPDGTFCVACILKDGKLQVPVEVVEGERVALRGAIGTSADSR